MQTQDASSPSHTPGPWHYFQHSRLITTAQPEKTVIAEATLLSQSERKANGLLIAAAPELFNACEAALFALEGHGAIAAQIRTALDHAKGLAP
jgi:hypothetical protein